MRYFLCLVRAPDPERLAMHRLRLECELREQFDGQRCYIKESGAVARERFSRNAV